MRSAGTVSVIATGHLLAAAAELGIDVPALKRDLGLTDALLDDPDARIPVALNNRIWQEAAARSNDPAFGLHLAENLPLTRLHIIDHVIAASATRGDALRRLSRYFVMLDDSVEIELSVLGDRLRLRLIFRPAAEPPRQAQESYLATLVIRGRLLLGGEGEAREVALPFPAPADASEHLRVYGCPVRFDEPECAAYVSASELEQPLRTADPMLSAILDEHAEVYLERLHRTDSLTSRVRNALADALPGGEPSLKAISKRLHMHPRTLQRRLVEDGTSFNEMLDRERRERALQHLSDPRMSIGEIGFLLGFSRPSAFVRAFRRWTGKTPGEHRVR